MSNYLPAALGIVAMLMASTALANEVSAPIGGKVAEQLQIPGLPDGLKLGMLMAQLEGFNFRTAQWGLNPIEGAMRREISTVGGPGIEAEVIDFAILNRVGLSRLPVVDPRMRVYRHPTASEATGPGRTAL